MGDKRVVDNTVQPLYQIAYTVPDLVYRAALALIDETQPRRTTIIASVALRALRGTSAEWEVLLLLFVRGCG